MPNYRRKIPTIQARHVNAQDWETCEHIANWCGAQLLDRNDFLAFNDHAVMYLNGAYVEDGDWIIRNALGDYHHVTDTTFRQLYEPVDTEKP